ncbi:MAG: ABC transporter ATP-binding protein [Clostridia bacterium]|nr:ABC transporter ATP-binding protein [Clostridia bacterium]
MVIVGMMISAITSMIVIINPYMSKILVDDVIKGGKRDWLIPVLLIMCGVVLTRTVLRYLMINLLEWSSQHMIVNIRKALFENLQYQEMRFFDRNRTGDIITRVTGDLDYLRHTVAWITYMLTDAVVTFLSAVIFLFYVSVPLTLSLLAVLPFLILVSIFYSKKVRPLYRDIRFRLSQVNVAAQENIAGNRVVKAFAREEYEKKKFLEKSEEFRQAHLKAAYAWQKIVPVIEFFAQLLTFITLLVGGFLVIQGDITLGELTLFTGLTWALAMPMRNISGLLNDLQRFFAAADKVIEVYYAKPTIVDRHDAVSLEGRMKGKIEFKNVSFKYTDEKVLNNISFTAQPGQTIAIMGPTGCGKTTLVNLISRFYDATEGKILLDDVDVRMRKLSDIRKSIGVATQDVFLFSDTVDGNISFGDPDMPQEQTYYYASAACADGFIRKMEEGYDTIIGERGVGLSGGQRQRVALARAMAVKPPILILDDTTSAVDMETEKEIQKNIRELPFDCTKIIIAQRISSVRHADCIYILENGSIQAGTHDQLARTNKYYREVCELQDVANLPEFEGGEL